MKNVLILHCWMDDSKAHWYPWLKKELEKKGYSVSLPDIPTMNTKLPSLAKQLAFIKKSIKIDKDTIVIGHSLGAVLGMRLGELYKFKKLVTVSGWDYNDLCAGHRLFWKTMLNHKKIKSNVGDIVCFGSDNDPYYTAIAFKDTSDRLGGKFVLLKGKGHFTKKDGVTKIPQLLEYIV